ncbi:MAG: hypothetical protein KJ057_15000 [Phycisphaerae bacterium]|nr:MAG: hypothetical protein EDS66_09690 [Planctomycetota bacterium]KAB2949173.1 MAG: hypothetical protein F9K17_03805 [Phycisphaerae bacterium]MBE7458688.1 hypothetical protein [Planctomycetia bacterium]MCK6466010.1 hypothetical protein [Phycisphaerae bacterium]MCL4719776.1 hypothetical protein [Phycisphaerae bacterium]
MHADESYLDLIRNALRVCLNYKPAFGYGSGNRITLERFQQIYREDEFYSWFGLDSPLVYAAHKAAGGMTSVYRQIGLGCQLLFQNILQDSLGLSPADATWSYKLKAKGTKGRTLSLDGRIPLDKITDAPARQRCAAWLAGAIASVGLKDRSAQSLDGCVFEVRQGYKSNDAKRQNADVSNAANAFAHRYLPVMLLLSVQIPVNLAERYARAHWLILRGTVGGSAIDSTYVFCRDVLGYDLAGFFRRNSAAIKAETLAVFEGLLR